MNKSEFFRLLYAYHRLEDLVFDAWISWRESQGLDANINETFEFDKGSDHTFIVKHDGEEDIMPMSACFHQGSDEPEFQILWSSNYYDGPISGVCKKIDTDETYWFDTNEMEYDNIFNMRRYAVYKLTEEETRKEHYWHGLFVQYVLEGIDPDYWYNDLKDKAYPKNYTSREPDGIYDEVFFKRQDRKRRIEP